VVTAAVNIADVDLLAAYEQHVETLPVTVGARWARRRAAWGFLADHPDLEAWMRRPTPARVADLHRAKAWPFVSWCFVEQHLQPDLELLLAKPGGVELPGTWAARHPEDVAAVAEAGRTLGWSENWIRQVSLLAASTICLHLGKRVAELTDGEFTEILGQLDELGCVTASARWHARKRLFAMRQACYQLGLLAAPPCKGGPVARTPAERAALVGRPEIRTEVLRYVTTIATTLRPTTVAGRTKALLVFFDYLAEHHPQVRRLDQIDRTAHIEPTWPGRGTVPGGGRTGATRPSRSPCSTRTSWICGASSKTSPDGAGRPRRRGGCCSTPTSHGCPTRCRARCRRTSTAH
jgi:hypothetical protein